MDTGSDFIRPEFLNILFFQQKNLVVFPYVDVKHLHALEIFTAGFNTVELDSTALHNLKEILEFEKSNSYSQNPTLFFITNVSQENIKKIMNLDGIRCIINSNDKTNFRELVNGSSFIFFNKKHNQFLNYDLTDSDLEFENQLIADSKDEAILQDKIQKLKIISRAIFTEINQSSSLDNLNELLSDYDKKYWEQILSFTEKYYDINIPEVDIDNFEVIKTPSKLNKDFISEYEICVSKNKQIGKEFIQLLHDYRSKKVNPSHLELQELYNPSRLFNYLRNHHWESGIPEDFIHEWSQMSISAYKLNESDQLDFEIILRELGINYSLPFSSFSEVISPQAETYSLEDIPSPTTDWERFKPWISRYLTNIEEVVDSKNNLSPSARSFLLNQVTDLATLFNIDTQETPQVSIQQKIQEPETQDRKILLVDLTNILNLDKNGNGDIQVKNIIKVHDTVVALGYTPKMWADASMRHHVDDKKLYEKLLDKGIVKQSPAGNKADIVVLKLAKKFNYKFLANYLYREYRNDYGKEWIKENRLTCVYEEGEFIIL